MFRELFCMALIYFYKNLIKKIKNDFIIVYNNFIIFI